ncbi:hypothetical protein AVEN_39860-1 [Araneus ventricosus]|uniref:Uncharacterized protein n=1 Tax=Araneus ventricosus TaxID=182803 RepID=A0A4Y2GSN4_ARAVE|nr:hypothetical protein AVEN_192217-1 [Araneus ventricosus]GBM56992.1 hypothetical protein AVEN_39860-1 [Araneus ventricosus]
MSSASLYILPSLTVENELWPISPTGLCSVCVGRAPRGPGDSLPGRNAGSFLERLRLPRQTLGQEDHLPCSERVKHRCTGCHVSLETDLFGDIHVLRHNRHARRCLGDILVTVER